MSRQVSTVLSGAAFSLIQQFKKGENNFLVWLLVMLDFCFCNISLHLCPVLEIWGLVPRAFKLKMFKSPGIPLSTSCIRHTLSL